MLGPLASRLFCSFLHKSYFGAHPDGLSLQQRTVHPGHHPRRQDFPAQRLGRAAGRRHEPVPPRWRPARQPPELIALVCSHNAQRRQVRGRASRPARLRAHGLGFLPEFRQGQQPAGCRSLPDTGRAGPLRPASFFAGPVPARCEARLGCVFFRLRFAGAGLFLRCDCRWRRFCPGAKKPPEGGFLVR